MKSHHTRFCGPMHFDKKSLAALAISLITLVGCAGNGIRVGTGRSGIDAEAQAEAEKYWNSLLTRCAGATYGQDNRQAVDQIYEFREVSIRTKPRKLTDADKQNGIEWSGDANLESKTSRILTGDKWGPWREGSIWLNSEKMEKVNGQWKFGVTEDARTPLRTFDCSKLP